MNDISGNQHWNQLPFEINEAEIVIRQAKDIKFVAWYTIITAALSCLSIIGAIPGIPLIIAGLRLKEASNTYFYYVQTNNRSALIDALVNQGKYFRIMKIIIIISLILMVLVLALYGFLFSILIKNSGHLFNSLPSI